MKALFDSNILIDYLNGIEQAKIEIDRYDQIYISSISWMEVMIGTIKEHESLTRTFLSRFEQVAIDHEVAELTILIRKKRKIRLPDAIIWASAKKHQALLISRNTKDFPESEPDIRVPYELPIE